MLGLCIICFDTLLPAAIAMAYKFLRPSRVCSTSTQSKSPPQSKLRALQQKPNSQHTAHMVLRSLKNRNRAVDPCLNSEIEAAPANHHNPSRPSRIEYFTTPATLLVRSPNPSPSETNPFTKTNLQR
ncbi:hypothetical protein M758_1G159300 [Ceratodon purpureus]|uniref:Uncharacterized protein n=1 Tax=Ceratodon purpureus TaxID=3225 RepID=A0A8T0J5U5_CERPU|nr:hypothetical protein KC19_1G163600 [Ceratodon purpureus]KAG0630171.1 hypothetical protein M758_1G159300 [Ceratodon purpureus]